MALKVVRIEAIGFTTFRLLHYRPAPRTLSSKALNQNPHGNPLGIAVGTTTVEAALHIVQEGFIRLSNFEPANQGWLPAPTFYARGSLHHFNAHSAKRRNLEGGAHRDPYACMAEFPLRTWMLEQALDKANGNLDTLDHHLTKPSSSASHHLRSTAGRTVSENAAAFFCSVIHGSDNR